MLQMDDDDGRPPILLPKELLLFIVRSLDDRDCVALALSGAFVGFASLYDAIRKGAAIRLSYRHHFLSNLSHWEKFLSQNSRFPSSITVLDVTNCYWVPARQLCDAVVQLANLDELRVNGTKLSLHDLVLIFTDCKKITKLDFKFVEKSWDEVLSAVGGGKKLDVMIESFKRLTSLKISTWCLDAKDYLNDPWVLIIRFMSWCRDCVGLTVEISYMGDAFIRNPLLALNSAEEEVQRMVRTDLFPKLEWMSNLKKLVLLKYGSFENQDYYRQVVRSLLLDDLCAFVFQEERAPSSLESVWIQDFQLATSLFPHWRNSPLKKSYCDTQHRVDLSEEDIYQMVLQEGSIENLGGIREFPNQNQREAHPQLYLPSLKYCHVSPRDDDEVNQQWLHNFIRDHPNLEQLLIEKVSNEFVPILDKNFKLPKLKTLSVEWGGFYSTITSKERMQNLANSCPNIEALQLVYWCLDDDIPDIPSGAYLSAISFKKLTSLSLGGEFKLHDGAFLLTVIHECPQLRSLHMEGTMEPDSFVTNFSHFLSRASKLRDLRLTLTSHGNDSLLLLLLKSIFSARLDLERLALLGNWRLDSVRSFHPSPDTDHRLCLMWNEPPDLVDFLVKFATEMKRLVFCCITFYELDAIVSNKINRLIAEKVVRFRPSLWFNVGLGNFIFTEDPTLPLIHFLEMIDFDYFVPPPIY